MECKQFYLIIKILFSGLNISHPFLPSCATIIKENKSLNLFTIHSLKEPTKLPVFNVDQIDSWTPCSPTISVNFFQIVIYRTLEFHERLRARKKSPLKHTLGCLQQFFHGTMERVGLFGWHSKTPTPLGRDIHIYDESLLCLILIGFWIFFSVEKILKKFENPWGKRQSWNYNSKT